MLDGLSFDKVFNNPKRKVSNRNIIIIAGIGCQQNPRLGMVVSKKQIPKAVDRNYTRRLFRESFRKKTANLPCWDFIVIARRSLLECSGAEILKQLDGLWQTYIKNNTKSKS